MRELRLALVGWLCVFVGSTVVFAVEPELLKIGQEPGSAESPRAVAVADFDGDGSVEAVAGFAASEDSGGLLVQGLEPKMATPVPGPSALRASVQPTGMAPPFRHVDLVPDFLWFQDFDRNGSPDLLIASRERSELQWLEPRPGGGFIEQATLRLPGSVTAGWFGELGGRNYRVQGALGVVTDTGPVLVMVESLSRHLAFPLDSIPLPAPAEAIFVADVDGDFLPQWIVQAGGSVYAVSWEELAPEPAGTRSGLRRPLRTDIRQIELPFGVRSMAVGDFRSGGADELAFVSADDRLILTDGSGRLLCSQEIASPQASLVSGELLLLEPLKSEVTHLRAISAPGDGACFETVSRVSGLDSPVLAAAAPNVRGDGLHLGWLRAGFSDPRWLSLSEPAFVVTAIDDRADGSCDPSHCSLREAILAAEARPGRDVIHFELGDGGSRTIVLQRPLPPLHDAVRLHGPSSAGESRIVLDGSQAGPDAVGLHLLADSNVIRGLTIEGFAGAALRIESSHNEIRDNVLEGNEVGLVLVSGRAQQIRHNKIQGQRTHGIVVSSQAPGSSLHPNRFVGNGGPDVHVQDSESVEDLGVSLVSAVPAYEGWLLVEARVRGTAGQRYDVTFYQSGSCEATGVGRGESYSATRTVWLSESGEGLLRTLVPGSIESGQALSATLVDAQGRTTGFSPCRMVDLELFRGSLDELENGFGNTCQVARPVARDDFITTNQGESVLFSPIANDSADTVQNNFGGILGEPSHGTAEVVGVDAILYDPFDPFFGQDQMGYVLVGCLQCGRFGCTEPEFDTADIFIDVLRVDRLLSVSKTGTGTGRVTSSPSGIDCGSKCSAPFALASDVTLTADPGSSSRVVGWSGDCSACGGSTSCTINMESDRSCSVEFRLIRRRLEVRKQGAGSGRVTSSPSGIDCGSDCVQRYNDGTEVTLTPAAGSLSNFLGWSGACSGGGTTQVVMTSDRVCVASFNAFPTARNDSVSVAEDSSQNITVLENDEDADGDALTVEVIEFPSRGKFRVLSDQRVRYSPRSNFHGTDSFIYVASDGKGGRTKATVSITVTPVNDAPVAQSDSATTAEDTAVSVPVLSNDSDVDGDSLVVSSASGAQHGTVSISGTSVVYTPGLNFHGTDSFTYVASDGEGGSDSATVSITVTPVNDAPVAQLDSATTAEDTAVSVPVLSNDSDVDGDSLVVSSASGAQHGTVSISGTSVEYTPGADFHGTDSFTYVASDGEGGSDTATVGVTVTSVNDAPVAQSDSATTAEDTAVSVPVLSNDSDVDGDSLVVSSASGAQHGTVSISGTSVVYTPGLNFHGTDSFTYVASDGEDGSDSATVSITVTPVNDAPVAQSDSATTAEDTAVSVPVLSNDSDVDGDSLVVSSASGAQHGTVSISGTSVEYTPGADFHGTDSFTYVASDGEGGSDTATVGVTVTPVNDFPVAQPDSVTMPEDAVVSIPVLSNDSDVDGDTLTVEVIEFPSRGKFRVLSDQRVRYSPRSNFHGTDSFIYVVSDGEGGRAKATVSITVTPVNDAPVAQSDSATTAEDTAVSIPVLSNDSDVDGDSLVVSSASGAQHGTVSISGTSVVYTPGLNFHGTDSFTYVASDGEGGSDTATVSVTVTPVNDAPVALCRDVMTTADAACQAAVSPSQVDAGSSDVDGDALALSLAPSGPFALGATPVSLSVSDGSLAATCSAVVDVVDQTSPTIQCPADVVQVTPDPNGDVVTFAVPAVADNCDVAPAVTCDPASGDVFSLGSQEVVCTAADASGNSSGCTFQVTLRSPADQQDVMDDIIRELVDLGILSRGQGNALLKKLENSLKSFDRGQTKASCNQLGAFENQIEDFLAESILSPEDGSRILLELQLLQDGLGCSG